VVVAPRGEKRVSTRDPDIGFLEAEVLRAVKKAGNATARKILDELRPSRTLAYTTVSTTLERLYRKGLVARTASSGKTGQVYIYSFPGDPGLEKQVVNRMVDRLVSAFGPSVVSTIYDRLSEISPEDATKLTEKIERQKRTSLGESPAAPTSNDELS
jgi:predicted transcriptional regulator